MKHQAILSIVFACLVGSSIGISTAHGAPVQQPLLAIACHWDPTPNPKRANGFDCSVSHGVAERRFDYDTQMSENEFLLRRNNAFRKVALSAASQCGSDCSFFYGSLGHQCLAVAQSRYYTGLGSFQGKEKTKADAERSALDFCNEHLTHADDDCRIIVSVCPKVEGTK